MDDAFKLVFGALIGAVVSYFLATQQARLELQGKIDEATRTARLNAYMQIWKLTSLLPKYPPATNVTYDQLSQLALEFRYWYFEVGGIYLSHESRTAYFKAQELLLALSEGKHGTLDPQAEKGDYWKAQAQLSKLRTQLTGDLRSRRRPGVIWSRFST